MSKTQIISTVRKLVSDAEIEKALKELTAFLQQSDQYDELNRAALQALSELQKTKRDEAMGIISFENAKLSYNQVTHRTLHIVDLLEAGQYKMDTPDSPRKPRRWTWAVGGIIALLVLGVLAVQMLDLGGGKAQTLSACPSYSQESQFNILLFRFLTLGGDPMNSHMAFRNRLGMLGNNFPADIGLFQDDGNDNELPANLRQAEKIGTTCDAQLVIMGMEEAVSGNTIISTQYRFINLGDNFPMTKLQITERQKVDTVTAISSITTEGEIVGNIEQAILLLFGIVAHEAGDHNKAVELLAKAEVTDSANTLLRDMTLGNSFLKMGDQEQAIRAYDKVLELHPNYPLALQNRATLSFEKGDYVGAANDLTTRVEIDPENAEARAQRGQVYLKINQLDKAKKDLEIAKKLKPGDKSIQRNIEILKRKEIEQRKLKKDADQTLQKDPDNINALNQRAAASKNLGDYTAAVASAERVLQRDPDNPQAYSVLMESASELNRPEMLQQVMQRIKQSKVNTQQLEVSSPTFYRMQRIDTATIRQH